MFNLKLRKLESHLLFLYLQNTMLTLLVIYGLLTPPTIQYSNYYTIVTLLSIQATYTTNNSGPGCSKAD